MKQLSIADLAGGAARHTGDPLADPYAVVGLDGADWADVDLLDRAVEALEQPSIVLIGTSGTGLPTAAAPLLEHLTLTLAPCGPGGTWVRDGNLSDIASNVGGSPLAAQTLAHLLIATSGADPRTGMELESAAYSALLAGPEFAHWLHSRVRRESARTGHEVLLDRAGNTLTVTLNRPDRHNAFNATMRDGLVDALELAHLDPTISQVVIRGAGKSFCSGGDLDEFATARDPVSAHLTRTARNAGLAVNRIRDRVRVTLHGACIGAGIEVPSFAGTVTADETAWFRLPELAMGLIPGAGGTVGITRRIGRWRTAYMALSGARVDVDTAVEWGLVDGRR
ncbi:enoyl-CoA hydratase/isomerase family protein [Trebonia sp.]|uniref:enoyl-CoA hydratase/isomerase family protein n=1 Tax=Trebonia sp. TaxID=2767075 RepID=UPI002615C0AF|nr:enoyl-CoA hydratase/isomerase family protein [Trebonia sp.]